MCPQPRYTIDSKTEKEINQFLTWEQNAIKEMVSIVKEDTKTLEELGSADLSS